MFYFFGLALTQLTLGKFIYFLNCHCVSSLVISINAFCQFCGTAQFILNPLKSSRSDFLSFIRQIFEKIRAKANRTQPTNHTTIRIQLHNSHIQHTIFGYNKLLIADSIIMIFVFKRFYPMRWSFSAMSRKSRNIYAKSPSASIGNNSHRHSH